VEEPFLSAIELQGVNDVMQTEIQTAEPLVPEPSAFEFEMVTEKLKRHKSPGTDQIPAEVFKAGSRKIRSEINKIIDSMWHKGQLHEGWKDSIIVTYHNKDDETNCGNYRDTSLLSTTYTIFSIILSSRITTFTQKITGDHQCGFRRSRETTDHIFCFRQMLETKCE
jgi:hypothetical protein